VRIKLKTNERQVKTNWFKHGFWNTLEHAITRGSDALVSLVLLWVLAPETFAKLASSQALIAPILFLFVAPETVLYRDYSVWRRDGVSAIAARLHALRKFAVGKAQFALVLSILIALFSAGSGFDRFYSLIWAFSLVLAPQLSGPDREFLRLDLQLKTLSALSLYQKLSMLCGTVIAALFFPGRLDVLAAFSVFSSLSTYKIASYQVKKQLRLEGASEAAIRGHEGPSVLTTLKEALATFSGWQHGIGVVMGWVQTMDLFFLSLLRFPGKEVGLYAAVLKIANFSLLLPTALSNLFTIWVGRRAVDAGHVEEVREIKRLTSLLSLGILVQGLVLYVVAPLIFSALSHGRWSPEDLGAMQTWFAWILAGSGIFGALLLISSWLLVRSPLPRYFRQVYLPWMVISLLAYFGMIQTHMNGSPYLGAATANVVVSISYAILLWRYFREAV
jgi:hypothetical protein